MPSIIKVKNWYAQSFKVGQIGYWIFISNSGWPGIVSQRNIISHHNVHLRIYLICHHQHFQAQWRSVSSRHQERNLICHIMSSILLHHHHLLTLICILWYPLVIGKEGKRNGDTCVFIYDTASQVQLLYQCRGNRLFSWSFNVYRKLCQDHWTDQASSWSSCDDCRQVSTESNDTEATNTTI